MVPDFSQYSQTYIIIVSPYTLAIVKGSLWMKWDILFQKAHKYTDNCYHHW